MYKLIVAGSRTVDKYYKVEELIDDIVKKLNTNGHYDIEIVSGNALGVDQYGERYAQNHHLDLVIMPANWKKHGKSAGPKRNMKMAEYADGLLAIQHNSSRGTQNMINLAINLGLQTWTFEYKG